ncbi:MAG TPA: PAS domain-containing sensor histidine kinase [Prolixibacteraceae bacterium]|nr:PAS domain-containing sensor histidine kinase [Prolixibacteraceae bacterium]
MQSDVNDRTDVNLVEKEELPIEKPRYERVKQITSEDNQAEAENQFHIQIENSADAIVLIDSKGIVKYQSPAYGKMMGHSDYQRIGRECIDFVHPDDFATFKLAFDKILKEPGLPVKFILRNQHINGSWLNLDCVANNLLWESDIQSIVVNISDSTDRWYAQEALRESEGLYADLVLNQIAGVYRILIKKQNSDHAIWNTITHEFVSDRFCDIIGIEKTLACELKASTIFEIIHPEDHRDFVIANEEANRNMHAFSWEGRIVANNATKWVRFESNPRQLDDGSIRWTGVVLDITRQKLGEELLKKNSDRLMKLNDCLSSLGTDSDININRLTALCGTLLSATYAYYNRLENGCLFTIGKWNLPEGYQERTSPEGYLCYDVIRKNSENAIIISNLPVTRYANTDPNVLAYALHTYCGHVVRSVGTPVGALCVIYNHDCQISTEDQKIIGIIASAIGNEDNRKHYNEMLKANEVKLKELNATKDKFFSIIAHDLKGAFSGIIGLSELLTEDAVKNDTSTITEYARMINTSAIQTHRLLDNLLNWARMQEGRISFKPVSNKLYSTVNEVFRLFTDSAEHKKIGLINQVPPHLNVFADAEMLNTILRNLISNAIKFTSAAGKVIVNATIGKSGVEIVVADNGKGISALDINKLFKVDIGFSTRGTENEKGTGLGLVLCKEFVEKHGGSISVESKQDFGSQFKFILPFNPNC